ncbi:MAG: AraC family transcriptional regulator [Polyangiaceae bacterium]|nr:AraC family transcriptional regulator [Polyangiaceae bacterium]
MGSGEPYIIASITQGLILGGMRVGLDPRDMLKHAGLDVDVLEDGDALVHFERQIEVSRMLFMHQPKFNTCLRVGKHFVPRRYGVIGNMLQHGTTFGQALVDFGKFQHLATNFIVRHISHVPEGMRITVQTHPMVEKHQRYWGPSGMHETSLASSVALGRQLTGKHIKPLRVSFRHIPIGDRDEHEEFFGVPVNFGSLVDEIVFDQETLDTPLLHTNHVMYRRALDLVLAKVDPTANLRPTGATVRQRLMHTLHDGIPKISAVARSMGMSTRTLQRRLVSEGTSFEGVLEQIRREMVLNYVVDASVSTYEIAGLVGFGEPSPFFRAFRRWFGCTPKEWRRKHGIA